MNSMRPRFTGLSYIVNGIVLYFTISLFLSVGDTVMSYFVPVHLETVLGSATFMGLILASSSLAGLVGDLFIGSWFSGRSYSFFLLTAIVGTIAFPLIFLISPQSLFAFIVAMIIWGLYYEFISFSNFNFIHTALKPDQHALGWGLLRSVKIIGWVVGPLIASFALSVNQFFPPAIALIFQLCALFLSLVSLRLLKAKQHAPKPATAKIPLLKILSQWRLLLRTMWPVLLFFFSLNLLDSGFWTVGTVLAETIKNHGNLGEWLFTAYEIPGLITGTLIGLIARPFGKKIPAFLFGWAGGIAFALSGIALTTNYIVILTFIGAFFLSISWPEIFATIEDYVARLGKLGNSMVGLQGAIASVAYIIGPILSGLLADTVGHQATFSILGLVIALTALVAFIIVPRKIRLPQTALHQIEIT